MNNKAWHYIPADKYCSKVTDGTHDTPKKVEHGKYLITSKHIKGIEVDFDSAYFISEEDFHEINKRSRVDQWDVIISMIGAYCGFCFIESNQIVDYAVKNVGLFKAGNKLDAQWLYYYLNSNIGKAHLDSIKSGSSQPYITLGGIRNLPILVPKDQEVKEKIINAISCIDAKIELNNRINAELEAMAKTLYDYWFVQFDFPFDFAQGKPDANGKPYKSSDGKMVYSPTLKREIPEGWKAEPLTKSCQVIDCLHSKKPDYQFEADAYYLLQLENILDNGQIDTSNRYYVSKSDYEDWTSRIEIKQYDVVMTNAGRIAAFAQIPKNVVCGIGRNITAIRPTEIAPNYFFLSLAAIDIQRQILTNLDHGAFFKSFNVKGIKALKLLRPAEVVETEFEEKVKPMIAMRNILMQENQGLSKLRNWLLPMLMNGQVTAK